MMKRDAIIENIQIHPMGEIRTGCEAFGITISTNFGVIDVFADSHVLVGHTDRSKCIEQSNCSRYLLLRTAFDTFIIDIKDQAISVYKTTIWGKGNEWTEEQAIYGNEKTHVSGFSRNYYLQFPFVRKAHFKQTFNNFKQMRIEQIATAVAAL